MRRKRFMFVPVVGLALLAGCAAEVDGPTPQVAKVTDKSVNNLGNDVICKCDDNRCINSVYELTIEGDGFAPLPVRLLEESPALELPTVTLTHSGGQKFVIDGVDPSKNKGATLAYLDAKHLELKLTDAYVNALPVGKYDVIVRNPNGNEGALKEGLEVVLGPVLESIAPTTACNTKDTEITLTGKNFRDGAEVIVGAATKATKVTFVSATTIKATVPSGMLPGKIDVRVQNPEGCASELENALDIVAPPEVTGVSPATVCTGGTLTITGKGFHSGASVKIGTSTLSGSSVTVKDSTTIEVNVGPMPPGGPYDVTVENPGGCADAKSTLSAAVTVKLGPVIVAVDPSTVYNKVDFPITIFGSDFPAGVTGTVDASPAVNLVIKAVSTAGDRIDAVVPKGIKPGTYDITIRDPAGGCSYTFKGALTVTDQLTLRICGIDPPFGYTKEQTDVTITSSASAGTGCSAGTKQFVSTPRAWLDIGGVLTALKAVAFVTPTSLTATVPENLTVSTTPYDLLVQNPDGSIGLLAKAFKVVSLPVPQIDSINPGDTDTQYSGPLDLTGKNFRKPVTIELIDAAGAKQALSGPTAPTATAASATLNVGTLGLSTGAYVVRLTNTDQGTYSDFSALAITNPSGNLGAWSASSAMTTARRRHTLVAGRISNAARYLYAIGGDGGSAASAPMDAVELAPLDKFGKVGAWVKQRYPLNTARTALAAFSKGRYIHVIGGQDKTAPLASVERAMILDPNDAPEIDTFSFTLGGKLEKGAWYYRIAATLPATDADNPSGETLPSDPVVIHAIKDVKVKLSWKAVTGAVSYRVYRSPKAGSAFGAEELLADKLTVTSYEDDGTKSTDPTITPLVKGSTGVWVTISNAALNTARAGHALSLATLGSMTRVYVAGGRTGSAGTTLDTVELASVSADGKTLGAFAAATNGLTDKRERLMLVVAESATSPKVPAGTTYFYAGGGEDGTGTTFKSGLRSLVNQTSGQPGAWADATEIKNAPFAAVGYLINDTYYFFGGSTGTTVLSAARSCEFTTVPAFSNCNSLASGSLPAARMNAAIALESAFFYISGGGATDGAATTSVIKTVY